MPVKRRSRPPVVKRSIVAVGASAGGIEALRTLVASLPPDLDAAVFVVLHISATSAGVLPSILNRAGHLRAASAIDGEPIRPGRIYVAPPDRHLLVREGVIRLDRGAKEHRLRPAVDPLFRSAAGAYGKRVVAVVLSGTLSDGALGLRAVKAHGGVAVVQDPRDAIFDSMPRQAIEMVDVDHVVPMSQMGGLLSRLCHDGDLEGQRMIPEPEWKPGTISCPDCGGMLSEQDENGKLRFRCRVGHAFGDDTLLGAQDDTVETALFVAARALAEKASLLRQLAQRSKAAGHGAMVQYFEDEAQVFDRRKELVLRFATQSTSFALAKAGATMAAAAGATGE